MARPPQHLSKEAKSWWRKLTDEYSIDDQAGLFILQTALEAFCRMREAQGIINKEGPVIKDRFEQLKAHPMCTVERDSRGQALAGLKALQLDLEPLQNRPGRPGGR